MTLREKLLARVAAGPGGCWVWTGKRSDRYGAFRVGGQTRTAHRWMWEVFRGPVPDGLELDHLCRNRFCVNPDHLEPVTHLENVRRGRAGKYKAELTHCPKGHAYDEANTYRRPDGMRGCRVCRREAANAHRRRNPEESRARCREYYHRTKNIRIG